MFKKISSRMSDHDRPDYDNPLDDSFWNVYVESYDKFKPTHKVPDTTTHKKSVELLPYNPKKYSSSSHSLLQLQKWFESMRLIVPPNAQLAAALKSPYAMGDPSKAFEWIRYFQLSCVGNFVTNSIVDKLGRSISYKGAENWENVMCYMDAVLFAMFAHLESFEPMLFISNKHQNRLIDQLSVLLRVYVNFLRSGQLITVDLTIRICEVLSKLGFTEAMSRKQQDSAALFQFLTETLSMPLLTFKVEIKHAGKFNKEDDHKYSKERMLFVSIPDEEEENEIIPDISEVPNYSEESESQVQFPKVVPTEKHVPATQAPVSTEKALPEVPVAKDSSEGATTVTPVETVSDSAQPVLESLNQVANSNTEAEVPHAYSPEHLDDDSVLLEECLEHYFSNSISVRRELERRATMESLRRAPSVLTEVPPSPTSSKFEPTFEQIEVVDKPDKPMRSDSKNTVNVRTRSSTLSLWSQDKPNKPREVNLPAWMFLRLLPFYTDDGPSGEPEAQSSREFARRRPILPLCLKRYSFDTSAHRSKRRIIIPPVIRLPQFVADEDDEDVAGDYKLILESAVCHRGTSINSGHFISLIRKNASNLEETEQEANNAIWYLYDDMKQKRVVETTFHDAFATEWPYMLFYRLVENHAPKIKPPQGSKNKWWSEEPVLSPILSANGVKEESVSVETRSGEKENIRTDELKHSSSPDISEKYFWYTTDSEKNYQKEVPNGAGGIGDAPPQSRRNSQWSSKSDTSYSLQQVTHELKKLSTDNSSSGISESSLKKKARSLLSSPRISSPRFSPRVEVKDDPLERVPPLHLDGKLHVSATDGISKHHHKKRRKEAYKRDKCVVM